MLCDLTRTLSELNLSEKIAVNLQTEETEYLMLASAQDRKNGKIAVTSSDYTVRVYNRSNLSHCCTLTGHTKQLTGVEFSHQSEDILYTSSQDTTVRLWDLRASNTDSVSTFEGSSSTQFSSLGLSINDRCLAAGTESVDGSDVFIVFWDARKNGGEALGCYSESHQDDITQVVFHPSDPDRLITGSLDGLVCLFDISEETEDDALLTSFNAESPTADIGWCGADDSNIYCITHMHSIHMWESAPEFDDVCILSREQVKQQMNEQTEYLVNCFHPSGSDALYVAGGNCRGDIQVYGLEEGHLRHVGDLKGGHSSLVRFTHWDRQSGTAISGGEDSMLCLWSKDGKFLSAEPSQRKAKSKSKVKSKHKAQHFKPV